MPNTEDESGKKDTVCSREKLQGMVTSYLSLATTSELQMDLDQLQHLLHLQKNCGNVTVT